MNRSILALLAFILPFQFSLAQSTDWRTYYEKSNYLRTPRYAETIDLCKRLDKTSPFVKYTSFGTSPQGRALPLLIVSKDRAFTPAEAKRTGKPVILIQSCIHPGESDGKDATLMLVRDIVITGAKRDLLDDAVMLFIPIFSVDGHERFGPFNRINQNGPEEMGWRVTAQNLNLNRDYMKAEAPEMQAWLRLFHQWLPDFFIDCHVTDGIDFQYDVTYAMEPWPNADRELSSWYETRYIPTLLRDVEAAGHGIAPYVIPREDHDLSQGLILGASGPRLSTGYCAKQNRPALLVETHMLKPYKTRVASTYAILESSIRFVGAHRDELRPLLRRIDERTASLSSRPEPTWIPLRFELTRESRLVPFKGVVTTRVQSELSGREWLRYSPQPQDTVIPYFDSFRVTDSASVPVAYVVPSEWSQFIERTKLHGIHARTLTRDTTAIVEWYQLSEPRWQERPNEGRHPVRFKSELRKERLTIPAGAFIVPMNQRTAQVIMHLLEPNAPDSYVGWGYLDAVFEQKEYAEAYVLEQMARDMMAKDPALKAEFETKVASDTTFAKNSYARLNFFYQRSPYWDKSIGRYPIVRMVRK